MSSEVRKSVGFSEETFYFKELYVFYFDFLFGSSLAIWFSYMKELYGSVNRVARITRDHSKPPKLPTREKIE